MEQNEIDAFGKYIYTHACLDCGHGLGTGDPCQWCGWPDKEGARADTAYHLRKLESKEKN